MKPGRPPERPGHGLTHEQVAEPFTERWQRCARLADGRDEPEKAEWLGRPDVWQVAKMEARCPGSGAGQSRVHGGTTVNGDCGKAGRPSLTTLRRGPKGWSDGERLDDAIENFRRTRWHDGSA